MGQMEEEVPGKGSGGDSAYVSADQTNEPAPTSYNGSGKSGKGSGEGKSGKGSGGYSEPALVEVREVIPLSTFQIAFVIHLVSLIHLILTRHTRSSAITSVQSSLRKIHASRPMAQALPAASPAREQTATTLRAVSPARESANTTGLGLDHVKVATAATKRAVESQARAVVLTVKAASMEVTKRAVESQARAVVLTAKAAITEVTKRAVESLARAVAVLARISTRLFASSPSHQPQPTNPRHPRHQCILQEARIHNATFISLPLMVKQCALTGTTTLLIAKMSSKVSMNAALN
jgi:hypothetical protein